MNLYETSLELREAVSRQLDLTQSVGDETLLNQIEDIVFQYAKTQRLTLKQKQELVQTIYHSLRGLDVLQPLLDDPQITEIMVNSVEEIFIEKEGQVFPVPLRFESEERLEDIIQSIVSKVNRIVNESSPIVDARLPDGSRVHAVLPPVALKGPTLTIRKFPEKPITIEDLIRWDSITVEAASFLEKLVRARYNIFISGGTGSGKTTLLNVLANFIPQDERVITIEDSAELQIKSIPNLVRLETRNPNTEGKGQISVRDLIRASLRMRPNRIVVGEVRGAEAFDMLQAMNTGHDGSLSTGHANSSTDMLSRLEMMVLAGSSLPLEAVRKQIASAIDIVIHLSRMRDRTRKVVEISEIVGMRDGEIRLQPLFAYRESGREGKREGGSLEATGHALVHRMKLEHYAF
jgi:pilus assembly protein CpaF